MFAGCHLTSLVTRTNHNTIDVYVRIIRTDYYAGQIFIPHRNAAPDRSGSFTPLFVVSSTGALDCAFVAMLFTFYAASLMSSRLD